MGRQRNSAHGHGNFDLLLKESFKDPIVENTSIFTNTFFGNTFCTERTSIPSWFHEELKRRRHTMVLSSHEQINQNYVIKETNTLNHRQEDLVNLKKEINTLKNHREGEFFNAKKVITSNHREEDLFNVVALLKECAKKKDIRTGTALHVEILKWNVLGDGAYLASSLINMYAKCEMLNQAQQVLEDLPIRNVISWNALITGYAQQGQVHKALNCFECMQCEGISPNGITFVCIMKACGKTKAIDEGKRIHEEIVCKGFLENDIVVGNALVDMYVKCGAIRKAKEVLEGLPNRDVVSWNALITGYAHDGLDTEVFTCFERMQRESIIPNIITFICILKACASARAIDKGKAIHEKIICRELLKRNVVLGTALVDMYAKCGMLTKARQVLDELAVRDAISWNALIAGYAQQDQGHEALICFEHMQNEGLSPDIITFHSLLKACGITQSLEKGKKIHKHIVSKGLLGKDIALGNALVDMYIKCCDLEKAEQVLEELPFRGVVSWNALISGYVQQDQGYEALNCFDIMQSEGLAPNAVTFTCILKASGIIGAIDKGKQIHEEIIYNGLLEKDIVLGNALVHMYAECGVPEKAHQVLEKLSVQHEGSWCSVIIGYAKQGRGHEALGCLERMQSGGLSPDTITCICMLNACGSTGAIDKGQKVYDEIVRRDLLAKDVVLGTALVDMYAKCGMLAKAKQVLEELPIRNVVTWCALISGYAQQGQGHEALAFFQQMQSEGISPNDITFLCVLSACSHSGLLYEAEMLFGDMNTKYGIVPNVEHHACMVMVFGYAGLFDKAVLVIKAMPSSDLHPTIWLALLGACRKWGHVKLGRLAFDQTLQLDESCGAAYVLMANIFATLGMQEDVDSVEAMRLKYATTTCWDELGKIMLGQCE